MEPRTAIVKIDSFLYDIENKLTEDSEADLLLFISNNLPGRHQSAIINMVYDGEYDMLDVKIYKEK